MTAPVHSRPVCSCHGIGACVHRRSYRPDADGFDEARGWEWHCIHRPQGCEGFSVIQLVRAEWATTELSDRLPPLEELPCRLPGADPASHMLVTPAERQAILAARRKAFRRDWSRMHGRRARLARAIRRRLS